MFPKIIILTCIIAISTVMAETDAERKARCEPEKQKADECGKEMFFLMDRKFVALTKEQLPTHCAKVDKAITCVKKYGESCLKGFTKQSLNTGLFGMRKHYKSICGPKATKADEFVNSIDWLNKDTIDEMYTCASSSIKIMQHIASKVSTHDQIPQACCSYWLSRDCMTEKMKKLTTKEKHDVLEKMSDDAMTSLINFLCSKQSSVTVCDGLMPEPMARMKKVFTEAKKGEHAERESYLIPFLDVISEDRPAE